MYSQFLEKKKTRQPNQAERPTSPRPSSGLVGPIARERSPPARADAPTPAPPPANTCARMYLLPWLPPARYAHAVDSLNLDSPMPLFIHCLGAPKPRTQSAERSLLSLSPHAEALLLLSHCCKRAQRTRSSTAPHARDPALSAAAHAQHPQRHPRRRGNPIVSSC
jgi:hypothetical protein